ncbi:MAG: flagellar basal body-associated FliL family protein [Pseudomonadota bacterium]
MAQNRSASGGMALNTPMKTRLKTTGVTAARVHTPGKYIIVFGILPLCILASLVAGLSVGGAGNQLPFAFQVRENASGEKTSYYILPEVLVDLAPTTQGQQKFLKARIALAVTGANPTQNRMLNDRRPLLAERASLFLRALEPEDFAGTNRMLRVKEALTRRMNLVLEEDLIEDAVLQNLIIQ